MISGSVTTPDGAAGAGAGSVGGAGAGRRHQHGGAGAGERVARHRAVVEPGAVRERDGHAARADRGARLDRRRRVADAVHARVDEVVDRLRPALRRAGHDERHVPHRPGGAPRRRVALAQGAPLQDAARAAGRAEERAGAAVADRALERREGGAIGRGADRRRTRRGGRLGRPGCLRLAHRARYDAARRASTARASAWRPPWSAAVRCSSSSSSSAGFAWPAQAPPHEQPPAPQRLSMRSDAPVAALPALRWSASTAEAPAPGASGATAGCRAVGAAGRAGGAAAIGADGLHPGEPPKCARRAQGPSGQRAIPTRATAELA